MFGEATELYQAHGFRILLKSDTKVLKNTWSKYEGTAIISLKPVRQVPWNPQTKPGQLEQERYRKKTEHSHPKGAHQILLLGLMLFFINQKLVPFYLITLRHNESLKEIFK